MSLLIVNTIQPQTGSIVNISGSLTISQSLIVADDITLSGKLTLGNANTDNIVVNSEFTSSLIPDIDGAFDLGTGVKKWGTVFAKSGSFDNISGSINLTNGLVSITSASINYLSGQLPGSITIGSEMIPDVTNTHNLGTAAKKFNDLFINDISASGDVTSSGTGSFTGGIDAMDATGSFGYISASGDISTSGDVYGVSGSFTTLTGTLTTAAQPNITSLGTLTSLTAEFANVSGYISSSTFQGNNIIIYGANGNISSSGNINAVNITASNNIIAGGTISASGNIIGGQISASRVSASAGFEADTLSTSSFGYISASGHISAAALNIYGPGGSTFYTNTTVQGATLTAWTGSVISNLTVGGNVSASRVSASAGFEADTLSTSSFGYISASGGITSEHVMSASGFNTTKNVAASADALSYIVNGRKVEVRNQVQATLSDGAFSFFTLLNTSIAPDSIVLGSFTGNTAGAITGSIITAATIGFYTASIQIHNESGEAVADDTPYTASFIVL